MRRILVNFLTFFIPFRRLRRKFRNALLRDGGVIELFYKKYGKECLYKKEGKEYLNFNGVHFSEDLGCVMSIIVTQENMTDYNFINSKEMIMIDVGMNVGVISLLKAKEKGIKKIYAFEPFKPTYDMAIKNINLNPELGKKIIAFNFGLGSEDKSLDMPYDKAAASCMTTTMDPKDTFVGKAGRLNLNSVEKIEIKKSSDILKQIISENPDDKVFLKMDCEGAEYEILPELDHAGVLKDIDLIILEWHFDAPEVLVNMLCDNGFICFKHVEHLSKKEGYSLEDLGIIKAVNCRK
jgi:FkbM family methyltransferase